MERFVTCSRGCAHWGAFGAAGLLFRVPDSASGEVSGGGGGGGGGGGVIGGVIDGGGGVIGGGGGGGEPRYLLVLRHPRSHQGGTWALPGGALLPGETPLAGALREAEEEIGPLPPGGRHPLEPLLVYVDDHGEWSYTTLVVDLAATFDPVMATWETAGWRWVTAGQALTMPMLPALRAAWPALTDRG